MTVIMTEGSMILETCMNAGMRIYLPAETLECAVVEETSCHHLYLRAENLSLPCRPSVYGDHRRAVWAVAWEIRDFREAVAITECTAGGLHLRRVPCQVWEAAECMKILVGIRLMIEGKTFSKLY